MAHPTAVFRILLLLVLGVVAGSSWGLPPGFEPLFNGKDLSGWWGATTEDPREWMSLTSADLAAKKAASLGDIRAHWRVEGSGEAAELVNDGEGLFLTTERLFGDFELVLEYRTVAGADSGVYLRGCPQVQIWDTSERGGKWDIGAKLGSGGLWNNSPGTAGKDPLVLADRAFGEWNALRVVMVGERVSVWLNDLMVVDHARMENYFDRSTPVPARGPIQLQTHGGEIRWRHIGIREIGAEEANRILWARDNDGYRTIFNGMDFEGWQGAVEGYQVVDRSIACVRGHGGTLYTKERFGDFVVRFEFLLPAGGNNGLAIRYPGVGDPAYSGMCELQVLDSEDPTYAGLDARQHHGSAYGQVAAHRGFLREAGIWNFQEVRVEGSRVVVELNGTRILDADLAVVEEFMYPAERFEGRDRREGHFGFAGHGDPVRFRSIRVRDLRQ